MHIRAKKILDFWFKAGSPSPQHVHIKPFHRNEKYIVTGNPEYKTRSRFPPSMEPLSKWDLRVLTGTLKGRLCRLGQLGVDKDEIHYAVMFDIVELILDLFFTCNSGLFKTLWTMLKLQEVEPSDYGIYVSQQKLMVASGGLCDFYEIKIQREEPTVISIRSRRNNEDYYYLKACAVLMRAC